MPTVIAALLLVPMAFGGVREPSQAGPKVLAEQHPPVTNASPPGYLTPAATPEMAVVLPTPPRPGSPRARADREVFRQTRRLAGTARWAAAVDDVSSSRDDLYRHFACSLGVRLTVSSAPKLTRLLDRASMDGAAFSSRPKAVFQARRPFLDAPGAICETRSSHLSSEPDYPSGHTTTGWSMALILAELAPDRATQILARGRAYGESRAVCGSHNVSAVDGGYISGAAFVAVLHGSKAFRSDMEEAREEVSRLRATGPTPTMCEAERVILGPSPY